MVCYDSRELVSARMFELLVGHSWILTIMLGYIAVNRSRVAFCLLCWNFSLYIPDNPTYSALLSLEWRKISWSTITSYNMSPFHAITNASSNNNNITIVALDFWIFLEKCWTNYLENLYFSIIISRWYFIENY